MIAKNISSSNTITPNKSALHLVGNMPKKDQVKRMKKEIFIDPTLTDYGKCSWATVETTGTITRRSDFTEQVSENSKLTTINSLCKNIKNVFCHKASSTELSLLAVKKPIDSHPEMAELSRFSGIIFTGILVSSLSPRVALVPS